MQLIGSTTSPYVRRLRIFMQDIPHEFVLIDIFNSRDRSTIVDINPTLKIPMLKDDEQVVLDSRMIYQYVSKKHQLPSLSWDQENLLTAIDSVNESLVQLLILSRSEIDVSADKLYFRIQRERIEAVFQHLEEEAAKGHFSGWDYLTISLYCLLDWVLFRNLFDFAKFETLSSLYQEWHSLAICHQTDPR